MGAVDKMKENRAVTLGLQEWLHFQKAAQDTKDDVLYSTATSCPSLRRYNTPAPMILNFEASSLGDLHEKPGDFG